jgi:Ca-activated chloride channel family protein
VTAWQFNLLGYAVQVAQPEFLALTVLALLGVGLAAFTTWRRTHTLARLGPERLINKIAPAASPVRYFTRNTLGWSALFFGALALSQPRCGSHTELSKRYGIDLVIALDASRSMLARDVKPSRIERAKLELSGLLDKLKGDRVGIVVFAGDAFVQCPLTNDYAAAKMFLRAIDPANMPVPGTDLARALDTSRDLLMEADRGAKSRAIVVLSDGEDFGDDVAESLKELKANGIRVITVGIGSAAGEPIPEIDKKGNVVGYVKDRTGQTVMSRLNETEMARVAEDTDGVYVPSQTGAIGVGAVAEELDRMEKAELESRITVSYDERFMFFLGPALALLALGFALRQGRPVRSLFWGVSGMMHAIAFVCFALLGVPTLLEAGNGVDAAQTDALRQVIFALQACVGVGSYLLALVLDLLVKREEGAT